MCRHLKNTEIMFGVLVVVVLTSVIDRILRKSMIFLFPSAHFLYNFFSLIIDETCEYEIVDHLSFIIRHSQDCLYKISSYQPPENSEGETDSHGL